MKGEEICHFWKQPEITKINVWRTLNIQSLFGEPCPSPSPPLPPAFCISMHMSQDNFTVDIFGQVGVVVKQKGSAMTVKLGGERNRNVNVDVADVVEVTGEEMEPRDMKSIATLSCGEKRFMMKQMWGNADGTAVRTEPGVMLADDDLTGIFEYLQWQYQQPEVVMVKASMAKFLLVEGVKTWQGMMAIQEIKDMFCRCEVLVVPIHCETPLHWTFLEIGRMNDGEVKYLKYYDWCRGMEMNRQLAQLFLIYLEQALKPGENLTLEVPAKTNHYVQRSMSNDCGLALWSCLENAMRMRRQELDIPVPALRCKYI